MPIQNIIENIMRSRALKAALNDAEKNLRVAAKQFLGSSDFKKNVESFSESLQQEGNDGLRRVADTDIIRQYRVAGPALGKRLPGDQPGFKDFDLAGLWAAREAKDTAQNLKNSIRAIRSIANGGISKSAEQFFAALNDLKQVAAGKSFDAVSEAGNVYLKAKEALAANSGVRTVAKEQRVANGSVYLHPGLSSMGLD